MVRMCIQTQEAGNKVKYSFSSCQAEREEWEWKDDTSPSQYWKEDIITKKYQNLPSENKNILAIWLQRPNSWSKHNPVLTNDWSDCQFAQILQKNSS